jgi:hypothetical protein
MTGYDATPQDDIEKSPRQLYSGAAGFDWVADDMRKSHSGADWLSTDGWGGDQAGLAYQAFAEVVGQMLDKVASVAQDCSDHADLLVYSARSWASLEQSLTDDLTRLSDQGEVQ